MLAKREEAVSKENVIVREYRKSEKIRENGWKMQKNELAQFAVSGSGRLSGSLVGAPSLRASEALIRSDPTRSACVCKTGGSGEFMGVVNDCHGIHGVYATGLWCCTRTYIPNHTDSRRPVSHVSWHVYCPLPTRTGMREHKVKSGRTSDLLDIPREPLAGA